MYFSYASYAPQEVPEVGEELVLEEGGDLWGIQVGNQAVDQQIHPHTKVEGCLTIASGADMKNFLQAAEDEGLLREIKVGRACHLN